MQGKMKRPFLKYMGFVGVIFIISSLATGYLFHWRMQHVLQRYSSIVKGQGLMLKERGAQLKALGVGMSSYAASESGRQPASAQRQALQRYADEVRKQGEDLQKYGGKLISDVQGEEPEAALTTIADIKPFVPENLNTIKEQGEKIQALEASNIKLQSRLQELLIRLSNCQTQYYRGPMYPPNGYQEAPGPESRFNE